MNDYEIFKSLTPSSSVQLNELETEAYNETKQLLKEHSNSIVEKIINVIIQEMDFRKIMSDMYVWQRVSSIKKGIKKALPNSFHYGE